jgi:hypothetical protein
VDVPVVRRIVVHRSMIDLGDMSDTAVGACLCGAVQFELQLPATWVAHCHCTMCRRAHGAAFVTWVSVPTAGPGGGRVVLRARREPRHVWLEVEDDGPGLPSGDPPVFDAFYSTKPDGTGLGLAIVHRIVTDHSGSIEVESRPGRTRFRVRVPL